MKPTAPLFAPAASGALGPLTYRTAGPRTIIQARSEPTGDPTAAQTTQRALAPVSVAALRYIWQNGLTPATWAKTPAARTRRLPAWPTAASTVLATLSREATPWIALSAVANGATSIDVSLIDPATLAASTTTATATIRYWNSAGHELPSGTATADGAGTLSILRADLPATAESMVLEAAGLTRSPLWAIPPPGDPIPTLGLVLWLRPEALAAYEQDDPVSTWPDAGPLALDATTPAGLNDPTADTAVFAPYTGLTVDADALDQGMGAPFTAECVDSGWTYAIVFRTPDAWAGNQPVLHVPWHRTGLDVNPFHWLMLYGVDYGPGDIRPQCETSKPPLDWSYIMPDRPIAPATKTLVAGRYDASALEQWFDGDPNTNNPAAGGPPLIDDIEEQRFNLARRHDNTWKSPAMTFAEVIVYNRALTNTDLTQVHTYLLARYGL